MAFKKTNIIELTEVTLSKRYDRVKKRADKVGEMAEKIAGDPTFLVNFFNTLDMTSFENTNQVIAVLAIDKKIFEAFTDDQKENIIFAAISKGAYIQLCGGLREGSQLVFKDIYYRVYRDIIFHEDASDEWDWDLPLEDF